MRKDLWLCWGVFLSVSVLAASSGCERSDAERGGEVRAVAPATTSTTVPGGSRAVAPPEKAEGEKQPVVSVTPPPFPPLAEKPAPPKTEADRACQEDRKCRDRGHCHADGDRCVVKFDSDCEASSRCRLYGRCSMGEDGECVARDEEDCARLCWREGRCQVQNDDCHVGDDSDCDIPCAREGRCEVKRTRVSGGIGFDRDLRKTRPASECVATPETKCSKTAVCHELGRCSIAVLRSHHGSPVEFGCTEKGSPSWRFEHRGRGGRYHEKMLERRREQMKQDASPK